ncbi:TIGR03915 family putative DNA repair protein [Uliginosibacterium gangwonense]|uniref:TIGR03915 family putative DNA repair protein n=1 Tax=Uliginosibacterium gangwonense TaxID=392736 RepID=UPI000372E2F5|nr:TIGR03915 family putative DNA repair protein [Uliginosibacterium gangwonense]
MYAPRVNSFETWLAAASTLIAAEAAPPLVDWGDTDGIESLFAASHAATPSASTPLDLPESLRQRLEEACCYLGKERWSLPYRVLWRCLHDDWAALLPGDADGSPFARRERAVRGAAHAMKGFLRFQERPTNTHSPRFVAWYEPPHDVLQAVARHFAERMGNNTWLIATPLGSANWDGKRLAFGPPLSKPAQNEDLIEALWLDYYRSTFNPERLNPGLMQAHLPGEQQRNLPEGRLIPALISEAQLGQSRQSRAPLPSIAKNATCANGREARLSLGNELENCRRCSLWEHATYPVGGSGPINARVIIVGEQADDHDDLIGEPFSGELGRFLESLLNAAGVAREEVYLTHAVKHFRFESIQLQRRYRAPTPAHINACHYWLEQELAQVPALAIVALGRSAAQAVLQTEVPLPMGEAPLVMPLAEKRVFVTWHPAYAQKTANPQARTAAQAHIVASLRHAWQLATSLQH